jgi:pimeloyl-ACP methyl ester carboxylesterase
VTTFILIPGAGGTSWYWHLVARGLRVAGHEAIAVELPGDDPDAGLPQYADLVVAAASRAVEPVLVAQSMGGFTAPLVWQRMPISRMVFVNAMIPIPGERPGQWWGDVGCVQAQQQAAARAGYSTDFAPEIHFLHDVPPELAAEGEPYQRPETERAFGDVCAFTAWPDVPLHAVAGRDDRFFPVEFQRWLARERLGIEADVLPGGHLIALSQPAALTQYLLSR